MSFKLKVSVPRITAADVAEMEARFPGLSKLAKIPVVSRKDDVEKAATVMAEKHLVKYEYVRDMESLVETDTGWDVTFNISGD